MKIVDQKSAVLEAVNLKKVYEDGVVALGGISFQVLPGQIYVMLGPNGAGKTTTINLFLNFIEPTAGEARIGGVVVHREPLQAKQLVSYIPENVMLYGNFTALQNIEFFAQLGRECRFSREECVRALHDVGLTESQSHKKIKEFSKGMRQKCAVAIAAVRNAPAVLLDEPTAGLDPKAAYEFLSLLSSLKRQGRAILMSTHDIFRAREIADTIAILRDGTIVLQESAASLANEDLEQVYLQHMSGHSVPSDVSE